MIRPGVQHQVAIALRVLSRVAENLKRIEKKETSSRSNLPETIERLEQRIAEAQEIFGLKWYEIDAEDRIAVLASNRNNMEF